MSGAPEHRYTDTDVRAEPDLVELAKEYLESYFGDFEPLVEAQQLHLRGFEMPTAIVRKVLNCMRNDAEWQACLPRPGTITLRQSRARLRSVPDPKPNRPKERSWQMYTHAEVHWEYGCPRMKGNLHVVEIARCVWRLPSDRFNRYKRSQSGQRVPQLEVIWICGKHCTDPRLSRDGEDLLREGRYITECSVCFAADIASAEGEKRA